MGQIATVTSKMQFTIPMLMAREVGVKSAEKVSVVVNRGQIVITPLPKLVEQIAGSVKIPKKLESKNIDEVINQAKADYFRFKYVKKT